MGKRVSEKNGTIELGQRVECLVTGFKGRTITKCEYLNGVVQFHVQPRAKGDGSKFPKGQWIDVNQLKVDGGVLKLIKGASAE